MASSLPTFTTLDEFPEDSGIQGKETEQEDTCVEVEFQEDTLIKDKVTGQQITAHGGTPTKLPKRNLSNLEFTPIPVTMTEEGENLICGEKEIEEGEESIEQHDEEDEETTESGQEMKKKFDPDRDFFAEGTGTNVLFLGPHQEPYYRWPMEMRDAFFIVVKGHQVSEAVRLRTSIDAKIGTAGRGVADFVRQKHQIPVDPKWIKVSLGGEDVTDHFLWGKEPAALFLIHEEELSEDLRLHRGKLWQCKECGAHSRRRADVKHKGKCKKTRFLFEHSKKKIGHEDSKGSRPQCCPKGHYGPQEIIPAEEQEDEGLTKRMEQAQPDADSERMKGGRKEQRQRHSRGKKPQERKEGTAEERRKKQDQGQVEVQEQQVQQEQEDGEAAAIDRAKADAQQRKEATGEERQRHSRGKKPQKRREGTAEERRKEQDQGQVEVQEQQVQQEQEDGEAAAIDRAEADAERGKEGKRKKEQKQRQSGGRKEQEQMNVQPEEGPVVQVKVHEQQQQVKNFSECISENIIIF